MRLRQVSTRVARALSAYFFLIGLLLHLLLPGIYFTNPLLLAKAFDRTLYELQARFRPAETAAVDTAASEREVAQLIGPWVPPLAVSGDGTGVIRVGTDTYQSLSAATSRLVDNDTLYIGEGIYREPLVIRANGVTVRGDGRVILEHGVHADKAAIVVKGNQTEIIGIECAHITVADGNGACLRLSGSDLKLARVYFHDSQQGLLTGSEPGLVEIQGSRFERLGYAGRAHGIYVGGGELTIRDSVFVAATGEGHEIKSRARTTIIERSLIASLSSTDSRLVDAADGGVLIIRDSVLQQGPRSRNWDAIGYGLERMRHRINRVELHNNLILLERTRVNILLASPPGIALDSSNNTIIAASLPGGPGRDRHFISREAAGMPPFPFMPRVGSDWPPADTAGTSVPP